MTAPETHMAAHIARRAGATEAKPQRVRGIVITPRGEICVISEGDLGDEHQVRWGHEPWSMP